MRQIQIHSSVDGKQNIYNVKPCAGMKKVKKSKLRLFKSNIKKAILTLTASLAIASALVAPTIISHIESNNITNNFVEDNTISYVETNDKGVNDGITYGTCPMEFPSGVVAYLDDTGDVLNTKYPIAQSGADDPRFYLHHDVNGNYSELGTIYKDSRNGAGLSNDVTVIYGHNLIDDSMFGKLTDYADKDSYLGARSGQSLYDEQKAKYGSEGNSFTYIDEYGEYRLDVCAAGVYDGLNIINLAGNFDSDESRQMATDYINSNSDITCDQKLDNNSKIVIFQTCEDGDSPTYSDPNKKVYVACKATELVRYKDLPSESLGNTR